MTDTAESLDPLRLPLIGERLIEASAGTGKTFTIAALYLRLLLGPQQHPRTAHRLPARRIRQSALQRVVGGDRR